MSVNWALTSGSDYFLLQTFADNAKYASYGLALPANSDISITQSGTFNSSIAEAVSNANGWGANEYWAAFNDITTGPGRTPVPEPASLAMVAIGLAGIASSRRRKAKS
jgi:PEP-CTERM motif